MGGRFSRNKSSPLVGQFTAVVFILLLFTPPPYLFAHSLISYYLCTFHCFGQGFGLYKRHRVFVAQCTSVKKFILHNVVKMGESTHTNNDNKGAFHKMFLCFLIIFKHATDFS